SMSAIDSMTMSAPWTRVNFGGANQPKRLGRKEPNNDHYRMRLPPGLPTSCFCGYRSDKDVDFLRLALADEIATSLSYVRALSIRPFATTSKYDSPTLDMQEAGRTSLRHNAYFGSVYSPSQSYVMPSAVPLPVQVPCPFTPFNLPVPPTSCHLCAVTFT